MRKFLFQMFASLNAVSLKIHPQKVCRYDTRKITKFFRCFHFWFWSFNNVSVTPVFTCSWFNMQSNRTLIRNCLYGININDGIVCFASPSVVRDNLLNSAPIKENIPELLNSILNNVCNVIPQQEDIVKGRINDRHIESTLKAKWSSSGCTWSSFLLAANSDTETSYYSSFVIKFDNEAKQNMEKYTQDVTDVAKSLGIPSISKLVPSECGLGYTVDIISCESKPRERIDQFDVLPVKYSGYHPSFDFGHSIYKSIDEMRRIIDLANLHLTLPEMKKLSHLFEEYSNRNFSPVKAYPNPFIVVEGLDGVGKFQM